MKTELYLGKLAAEREKYAIQAFQLYTYNTGYEYFGDHVAEAISRGNSAWGHIPYPQDTARKNSKIIRDRKITKAVRDLKHWGILEVNPHSFYRDHYPDSYKLKQDRVQDVTFGLLASKRTYRVLVEISKVKDIKDYKLFGRSVLNKKSNGFQGARWKCKIRHAYCYVEIDDLIDLNLIISTDGSMGYRKYSITEEGRDFMRDNKQYLNSEYRI